MSLRQAVLEALRAARGSFVSGEELSKKLGVTRAAVWKQIKSLRAQGYKIQAHPRQGYSLAGAPDLLLPEEVQAGLATKRLGRKVFYFPATDSTNWQAQELAVRGEPEGALVIAEEQLRGRGRLGRSWTSPRGKGIWVSLILRPRLLPAEVPRLTLLAAVAVAEAIRRTTSLPAGIKWPNDVLVHEKKVCGILTESRAELDTVYFVVVGVGINVNLSPEDFPEELRAVATSLRIEGGREFSRKELLQAFLREFEALYSILEERGFAEVRERWKRLSVTLGRTVRVSLGKEVHVGEALDIDETGALLVRKPGGEVLRFFAGEVTLK